MPGVSAIVFGAKYLSKEDIEGKRVIDVGACDFNGSIRPLIESWQPSEYIGVDIIKGPCVDVVCSADDLVKTFGKESFDVVLSVEMLEHSRHWKKSISNIKQICKPGGIIILTTRSLGYPCHGFPNDFWRFDLQDMKNIFDDFNIVELEEDYQAPGVFIKAIKPDLFRENDLADYKIYSIVTNTPKPTLSNDDFKTSYFYRLGMKQRIKRWCSSIYMALGRQVSGLLKI